MLTEKQLKIFEVFVKDPFAEHTRKEIKKESREKSNNALALAINKMKKEGIISEKKVGKSGLLTINLNNELALIYIALCNETRANEEVEEAIRRIREEIDEESVFYSIAIFGSYAIGEQKKTSDLDLAIFIDGADNKKKIEALVNSAKLKTTIKIDAHVIPKEEMIEMLTNKEENLGKQIARKHMAMHNHRIFYELLKEGMRRGFRV